MKKNIISVVLGLAAAGGIAAGYVNYMAYKKSEDKVKRLDSYYHIMEHWIRKKQENADLKEVMDKFGCEDVAIYGMGVLGELFYNEAKKAGIEIKAFVDKSAEILIEGPDGISVIGIDDIKSMGIKTVIVTPTFAFEQIAAQIKESQGDFVNVISLDEIYG